MRYDASLRDLLFPEKIPPMFAAAKAYSRLMVAAESARLAYFRFEEDEESRRSIESALRIVGFDRVEYFIGKEQGGHAIAALQSTGNEALVAFRGTRPTKFKDIEIDLELDRVAWPQGGTVHRGFATQFGELADPIRRWHERTAGRGLLITGHSLGAGLATLAATQLKPSALVTLGSSRVGDAEFASLFASAEVDRFVNCCDVITRLPTLPGYEHVCGCRYLDRNGSELIEPPADVIAADCRRARWDYLVRYAWRWGEVWLRDAADHAPINYVTAILGEREP